VTNRFEKLKMNSKKITWTIGLVIGAAGGIFAQDPLKKDTLPPGYINYPAKKDTISPGHINYPIIRDSLPDVNKILKRDSCRGGGQTKNNRLPILKRIAK
jgi:hypothetical protein